MRIINKKYLSIILLVGIILTSIIILKPEDNIQLDNVILKQEVNNKTFAMYKEESANNYVPVEGTKFPEGYVLNIKTSKCIDNNGNELNGVLSYENDKVVLTTNKSSYCYLYFDKSLGLEIKDVNSNGLKTDKTRGEMYRYQGQQTDNVENYICFGTSDKDTCIGDTDHYMYRIIGIEAETGRVKVIKKEALNETYKWWDNYNEDITFPNSKIYEAIKGTGFLKNTAYVPEGWEEKITNNTWMYGDMHSNNTIGANQTGEGLYLVEIGQKGTIWDAKANEWDEGALSYVVTDAHSPYYNKTFYYIRHNNEKWSKTFPEKVSLMYLHDYYYSISDEINCHIDEGKYEECKTGWMHLSQNDPSVSGSGVHEWTMSRNGWGIGYGWFRARYLDNAGYFVSSSLDMSYSVRPVFYINASEELFSGSGTITDPFIIK